MEELEIGNDHVDGAVREPPLVLDQVKEIAHMLPGSILRRDGDVLKVIEIGFDIRRIRADGIIGKFSGPKHLNKS